MAKITNEQMQVLINCIGAVETGGQVYGKRRYDDYTNAYTNSSAEDSITIGAFQEFKGYAKALLQEIKDTYPSVFSKYDDAGIASDLQKSSWSGYNPSKTSAKAKAIVKIISSDEGKKVQDTRIVKLLNQYISYAESLGVENVDALFMCANFIHQGGNSACKRLVGKISKPYTLDKLYNATLSDTGNQVGVYKTRQKLMYGWIKQYISNGSTNTNQNTGGVSMNEAQLRQKPIDYLKQYVGISEGSSGHKAILKVFNDSGLCSRYKMTVNDAWCATSVSAAFIASGLSKIFPCVECSCEYMIKLASSAGIWVENDAYKPNTGDVILYDWDDNGSGDNTGWSDHVGIVVSCDGSTIKVIEGNKSNTVGYRNIAVNGRYIRGFITPKYSTMATGSSSNTEQTTSNSSTGSTVTKPASGTTFNKTSKWVGVVTADELNIRKGAGTDWDTCSFSPLKEGTEVDVCDTCSNGWYYIKYNNKYGFCSNLYIKKKATNTTTTTTTKKPTTTTTTTAKSNGGLNRTQKWVGKVTADTLNVRSWAGTENPNIKSYPQLAEGNLVAVCDTVKDSKGANWYYVLIANKYYGFVHSDYIKKV